MKKKQKRHLNQIKQSFIDEVDIKYRKGQKEHGGDLLKKDAKFLLENAIQEAIDQYVYLVTLREKMK